MTHFISTRATSADPALIDEPLFAEYAPTDFAESLDLRLIASGRLSPTAVHIRRDRAELAAVLASPTHSNPDRNPR